MSSLDRSLYLDLVGVPFRPFGRTVKGLDCFGLVMLLYKRRGIIVPDVKYGDTDESRNKAITSAENLKGWEAVKQSPGVAVAFRKNGIVQHCGVVIDDDRFIHSSEDHSGVVIGRFSRNGNFHRQMVAGFYDYRA